jgi:dihydroorotate dehydrogenase (fumarate)
MANLKTIYMGIPLKNPFVVAACPISSMIDKIKMAEQAGAGALVIRSLFEEQIQQDALRLEEELSVGAESFAEAITYFPKLEHGGAAEHLYWIERTRAEVQMPLIASLNAATPGSWIEYARKLEETGVDGLELNIYAVRTDPALDAAQIEQELLTIVEGVRAEVKIPLSVKLSPFYTSLPHLVAQLEKRGVQAVVLFNRFLQPEIDPASQSLESKMVLSTPAEIRLPLRWVALLHGRTGMDLALNTGVHSGLDAAKALLAGAAVVQTASALLKNGIPYLSTMLLELEGWMAEHGYERLDEVRGKLSQREASNPFALERAHYVNMLIGQK